MRNLRNGCAERRVHAAGPRMNLDLTADDLFLHPHVSCVKTSHKAAQLDVNPEQRSVRQSTMSGPHCGDGAHVCTTLRRSRKFIRASSVVQAIRHGLAPCRAEVGGPAVASVGAGPIPLGVSWGLRPLYLSTPARHLSTPTRPERVFDLFTRVSQVSRPLTSPALSLQRRIVHRAADCRLHLARDLVDLVSGFIRTAHWRVLVLGYE